MPKITILDLFSPGDAGRLARSINKVNGWDEDFSLENIPGYLVLIHAEISEAVNET